MTREQGILVAATLLAAVGMGLALPRGGARGRRFGALLGVVSLGLFGSQVPYLGNWGEHGLFLILGGVTVLAAAATVTVRSPVYSAIWFALSLLGTAALFLAQGAQFLGVATIVVYAGAILVTFLFVLMLANPTGQAYYDRLSWEAALSAGAGAVLVGILTVALAGDLPHSRASEQATAQSAELDAAAALPGGVLADEHMATLGGQLFSRHLIAVEVAGTLLLVALVGAVAIIGNARPGSTAGPNRAGGVREENGHAR